MTQIPKSARTAQDASLEDQVMKSNQSLKSCFRAIGKVAIYCWLKALDVFSLKG